jgi:hypothetical protein
LLLFKGATFAAFSDGPLGTIIKKHSTMNKALLLSLFLLLFNNSYSQIKELEEESTYDSKSPELKQIIANFKSLSNDIDFIYKSDSAKIELFLQINENGIIKKLPNFNKLPKSFFSSFNLIKNKAGDTIYIAEYPNSESGDWFLVYENYYNEKGDLIAFIRNCNFFNGECAEIVYEKSKYYYNSDHILIKKTYEITDANQKPLDFKKCAFYYRYNYKIYKTFKDYLKNHKFE